MKSQRQAKILEIIATQNVETQEQLLEELNAAKEALLCQLRGTHDSPGAIESYYATAALSGLTMTPAEYMQAVAAVTAEDVTAVARAVALHTVYFLKGDDQ